MSKYKAKSVLRSAKNFSKGYSDIQVKVREATCNDPWGPSGQEMAEIARATFVDAQFYEIMDMLDKRMNDHGKNWRHALIVLEYCLHVGSENVVRYARENMHIIKTLKQFMHTDDQGKDQGANVRQKSKDLVLLLADEARLREARQNRSALSERMVSQYPNQNVNSRRLSSAQDYAADEQEQRELELALELSKRSAEDHDKKLKETDREFQVALSRSMTELDKMKPDLNKKTEKANLVDLLGDEEPLSGNAMINKNSVNGQVGNRMVTSKSEIISYNPFINNVSSFDSCHSVASYRSFEQSTRPAIPAQISNQTFLQVPNSTPYVSGEYDPNKQMGIIARNTELIDPFAELASSRINQAGIQQQQSHSVLQQSYQNLQQTHVNLPGIQNNQPSIPGLQPSHLGLQQEQMQQNQFLHNQIPQAQLQQSQNQRAQFQGQIQQNPGYFQQNQIQQSQLQQTQIQHGQFQQNQVQQGQNNAMQQSQFQKSQLNLHQVQIEQVQQGQTNPFTSTLQKSSSAQSIQVTSNPFVNFDNMFDNSVAKKFETASTEIPPSLNQLATKTTNFQPVAYQSTNNQSSAFNSQHTNVAYSGYQGHNVGPGNLAPGTSSFPGVAGFNMNKGYNPSAGQNNDPRSNNPFL